MKITHIICAAITAAVSANTFAIEIHKGKLISHKEWSTGGAMTAFVAGTKTKQTMMQAHKQVSDGSSYAYLESEFRPVSTLTGRVVELKNDAGVYIANNTDQTETYQYFVSICLERFTGMAECVHSRDFVELAPGGAFSLSNLPVLRAKFEQPGNYTVYADSVLYNNGKQMVSSSVGDVTVS